MTIYTHFHFHSNFWYAEYTHAQAINQFLRLYQKTQDEFTAHPDVTCSWDQDVSLTSWIDLNQDNGKRTE
jgi:hypothetical protein